MMIRLDYRPTPGDVLTFRRGITINGESIVAGDQFLVQAARRIPGDADEFEVDVERSPKAMEAHA